MTYKKSFLWGFVIGVILVFITSLGLVIGLIEFLAPVLSPGTELFRDTFENIPLNPLVIGFLLNGLIYGVLFMAITFVRKNFQSTAIRALGIIIIILIFFYLTGMITAINDYIDSPDKSWIFQIGA